MLASCRPSDDMSAARQGPVYKIYLHLNSSLTKSGFVHNCQVRQASSFIDKQQLHHKSNSFSHHHSSQQRIASQSLRCADILEFTSAAVLAPDILLVEDPTARLAEDMAGYRVLAHNAPQLAVAPTMSPLLPQAKQVNAWSGDIITGRASPGPDHIQ